MRSRLWLTFGLIVILTALSTFISLPKTNYLKFGGGYRDISIKEGLDLKGGASFTYLAETGSLKGGQLNSAMEGVRNVIEGRINQLGVSEPEIRRSKIGDREAIVISLPGLTDIAKAKDLIGSTAKLEFRDESGQLVLTGTDLEPNGADTSPQQGSNSTNLSANNNWQVNITLNPSGTDKFAKATAANIGKSIGIYLDNLPISQPTVQSAITGGQAVITGNFTAAQAKDFALKLNSGALPVPITLAQESSIGASLGSDAISRSLIAGLIGLGLLFIYLTSYYRVPGLLASIALLLYAALNIALYKLIPITLTLAGVAGFIISLGISTDTNILTFERLKEELRLGKPLAIAVQQSFRRSWTSIRDSHIAGLISSSVIFLFGSGSVRGFALVLFLGTLLSLFSAITVTRNWMLLLAGSRFSYLLTNI